MFATCIFCSQPLGANEAIEEFPVGRRLAFDGAKGRLWVVCRKCERWNLSPLDTRWEAIEACERAFRDTRLRVSTDNIGLARLHEGLELVRVGQPLRPEFAAWRYGDQFGRRRRRAILVGGGVTIGIAAIYAAGAAAGLSIGAFGGFSGQMYRRLTSGRPIQIRTPNGHLIKVDGVSVRETRLTLDHETGLPVLALKHKKSVVTYTGDPALLMAGRLVPAINPGGGGKRAVHDAVVELESRRGPEAFIQSFLADQSRTSTPMKAKAIAAMPTPTRLALEMALHEEAERRAIEGELSILEAAWREADEIAGIADNLLVSGAVEERLLDLKRRSGPRSE